MRCIFMGTPDFAVPALVAVAQKHEILAVYTQPDRPVGRGLELRASPVKKRAIELGIKRIEQPEKLSQPGEFEKLEALRPDIIIVVAYGQILKKNVLTLPKLGCINIHSSLLPRWRGAAPIQWALLGGDQETGVSTMKLVEKLDAGDVLLQAKTNISSDDTAGTIHDRLAQLGAELIGPTLAGLEAGTLVGQPQNETQVTYATKLTKEMESLNFSEGAETLDRRIRALNPWPGTSVWIKASGERLKIKRVKLRRDIVAAEGQIVNRVGMALLGTSSGSLELETVQWDGKREVDAASFLNGLKGRGITLPLELSSHP